MKKFDPKAASVEELAARFLQLSLEEDKWEREYVGARANRAIRERFSAEEELKQRDGDKRRVLVQFYEHPNVQVQANAASATMALFPDAARRKMEHIRRWSTGHIRLQVGMELKMIDTGRYVPK